MSRFIEILLFCCIETFLTSPSVNAASTSTNASTESFQLSYNSFFDLVTHFQLWNYRLDLLTLNLQQLSFR